MLWMVICFIYIGLFLLSVIDLLSVIGWIGFIMLCVWHVCFRLLTFFLILQGLERMEYLQYLHLFSVLVVKKNRSVLFHSAIPFGFQP